MGQKIRIERPSKLVMPDLTFAALERHFGDKFTIKNFEFDEGAGIVTVELADSHAPLTPQDLNELKLAATRRVVLQRERAGSWEDVV